MRTPWSRAPTSSYNPTADPGAGSHLWSSNLGQSLLILDSPGVGYTWERAQEVGKDPWASPQPTGPRTKVRNLHSSSMRRWNDCSKAFAKRTCLKADMSLHVHPWRIRHGAHPKLSSCSTSPAPSCWPHQLTQPGSEAAGTRAGGLDITCPPAAGIRGAGGMDTTCTSSWHL